MFIVVVLCLHVTCLADSLTPASIPKPSLDNDDDKLSFLSLFFFLPMHIHFPRHYMNVSFISSCLSKPMTGHNILLLLLVVASFTSAVPVYQEPGVLYLPDNAIVLGT